MNGEIPGKCCIHVYLNDTCFQEYQNAQAPFESMTVNQTIIHKLNGNFKLLE